MALTALKNDSDYINFKDSVNKYVVSSACSTKSTYWRFAFAVRAGNGTYSYDSTNNKYVAYAGSGQMYRSFNVKYLLAHDGGTGNYFMNAKWRFSTTVKIGKSSASFRRDFRPTESVYPKKNTEYTVTNSIETVEDYSVVCTATYYMPVSDSVAISLTKFDSATGSMSEIEGSTSPHSSSGGTVSNILIDKETYPVASSVINGTISIVDLGNNTFSISGRTGRSGFCNKFNSSSSYYTTDGTIPTDRLSAAGKSYYENTDYTKTLYCPVAKSTVVKAVLYTVGRLNTVNTSVVQATVKYYDTPKKPSSVRFDRGGTVNIVDGATILWGKSTTDYDTVLSGARLKIYKVNGTTRTLLKTYNISDMSVETFTIDGSEFAALGISIGDSILCSVEYYGFNGAGTELNSGAVQTDSVTVQGKAFSNIRVGESWKQGVTYICVNGRWISANDVYMYVDGEGWCKSIQ